jgi:hypothetical protein
MKKAILSIAAIAGFTAAAQAQINFAPEVGLNISTMKYSTNSTSSESKSLAGIKAGAFVELPFNKVVSLEPGVFYSRKGGEYSNILGTTTTTLDYVEVPVNLKFSLPLGIGGRPFVYAGPYFAYGVGGKNTLSNSLGTVSSDVNFGSGSAQMNPLDIGAQVGLGYQLPVIGLYARAQYGMGFTNLSNASNVTTTNNSNFSVSVGWQF